MNFPKGYEWLSDVGTLPKTISEAFKEYGTLETQGTGNNAKILGWAEEVGVDKTYSADSIPWCGLFVAVITKRARKAVVDAPLWAANWAKFGLPVTGRRKPSLGDVLVFRRPGGGHVAFYLGETSTHYLCLGGNQSDKVCIAGIPKARCVAVRRPTYNEQPASVKPYLLGGAHVVEGTES